MSEGHFGLLPALVLALMMAGLHVKYGLLWMSGDKGLTRYWSRWAGASAIQNGSKLLLLAALLLALAAPFVAPSWIVFLVALGLFAGHAILFVIVSR